MLTKKVKSRISFLVISIVLLITSVFFILNSLKENVLYFLTPTEAKFKEDLEIGKNIRIGGMVKKGSIYADSKEIKFTITDFENEILVSFSGTVPNLFAEEKGVVAEGKLKDKNFFVADRILAKHDENYMPPKEKNFLDNNAK